jgi:hypothetical protein
MSDHEQETEQAANRESTGDSRMSFDCCGTQMGDAMAGCRCGSIMRRHPFATFAICTVMGLALLVIPVGAILGIIAFLRTI